MFLTFWNFRHRLVRLYWYGSIHESLWMYHHQNGAGMEFTVLTKYFPELLSMCQQKNLRWVLYPINMHPKMKKKQKYPQIINGCFFLNSLIACETHEQKVELRRGVHSNQHPRVSPPPVPHDDQVFGFVGTSSWKKKHRKGENHVGRKSWG